MIIIYNRGDWAFRIKQDGDNYWLGFMSEDKNDLEETRINRGVFFALKTLWKK